jgi:Arc/MetJ-type ribon-helix-helix transcriptional regulator
MIVGMTKAKIAVTLNQALVDQAKRAVADGRASSVSAYVEDALAAKTAVDSLDLLLAELLSETGGPLSDQERADADRALG